jgi:hypothetical protein
MFLAFHILIFTETTSAKLPKKIEPNFAGMVFGKRIFRFIQMKLILLYVIWPKSGNYLNSNDGKYLYTPRNEVVGGYTGFTMSVRPSVCRQILCRTIT